MKENGENNKQQIGSQDQDDEDLNFPTLDFPQEEASPRAVAAAPSNGPKGLQMSMETVRTHHPHIARALDSLWGFEQCQVYLQRLIQDGADGQEKVRRGFSDEVMQALLTIAQEHKVTHR